MTRQEIYKKTEDYIGRGNWGKIFLVSLIAGAIASVITSIFTSGSLFSSIGSLSYMTDPTDIVKIYLSYSRRILFIGLITTLLTYPVHHFVELVILDDYEHGYGVNINTYIDFFKEKDYLISALVVGAIISLVNFIAGAIPVVGSIANVIAGLVLVFVPFIVYRQNITDPKDIIEAAQKSWRMMDGRKMDIFKIRIYYWLRPLIGVLVMIVGFLVMLASPKIGGVIIFLGVIALSALSIYYAPFAKTATVIYFLEHEEALMRDFGAQVVSKKQSPKKQAQANNTGIRITNNQDTEDSE